MFLSFGEMSISVQSALGELWVVEVPHIIRDEGWNAQHCFFVYLFLSHIEDMRTG